MPSAIVVQVLETASFTEPEERPILQPGRAAVRIDPGLRRLPEEAARGADAGSATLTSSQVCLSVLDLVDRPRLFGAQSTSTMSMSAGT